MDYKGLTLDQFQIDSIKAIDNNHSIVVSAPTGSGKTLIADYIINREIPKGTRVIYTAPIKALSNQKYKEFSTEYGKDKVGLMTGDVVKNPDGQVLIMTTEIYRNMVLLNDAVVQNISYVIFDEIHYINDIERGYVWEESIIFSDDHIRFLCLSATIPNAKEFASWIESIKNHKVDVIRHNIRFVPLHKAFYDVELGITSLDNIKERARIPDYYKAVGRKRKKKRRPIPKPNHLELIRLITDKLPALFFTFSRMSCQEHARELASSGILEHDARLARVLDKKLAEAPPELFSLNSTKILKKTLPYGIAFHHAGLIPVLKEVVEELFSQGLIKVLYTTETFAVGINMPAKTVCFDSLRKYDGISFRVLNSKEYFQIAGRAGRRGIDKEGFVYSMVYRQSAEFDKIARITKSDTEPIKSQFKLSINTVLNLIKQHTQEEIDEILSKSFYAFQHYTQKNKETKKFHSRFEALRQKLTKLGYIEDGKLTDKGEFASKIYADEIAISEIFSTQIYTKLNEYQILLALAAICFEGRERTEFGKEHRTKDLEELYRLIYASDVLKRDKRFLKMEELTAIIRPLYLGTSFFDLIDETNMLEGDVIRFFRQIVDRIGQIKQATTDDRLKGLVTSCQGIIMDCITEIEVID